VSAADVIKYADLVSALFGLVASAVLAVPALSAVRFKRYWENARDLATDPEHRPETKAALKDIQDGHVVRAQLGDSRVARKINLWGFSLLAASFFFLLIAAVARVSGGGESPTPARTATPIAAPTPH
jgi:hypothetical protein